MFFDKWHCAWLCRAELDGLSTDPVLPQLEDFSVLDEVMVKVRLSPLAFGLSEALAFLDQRRVLPMARALGEVAERHI